MIIRRITLTDFQIFYGQQTLDLGRGLYVVHGENGRGKTTLLNAVYFALFGRYYDRRGNPVSPRVMLNRDAEREGRSEARIELELDDGGKAILIRRSVQVSESDAEIRSYVEVDGEPLDEFSAGMLIRGLLDEEVARFFLFDGEQLRQYEEMLFSSEESAEAVRRSIEQVLGLPAITNAVTDLKEVVERYDKAITTAAREETATRRAALRAEQWMQDLEHARDDLKRLQEEKATAEEEVEEATQKLQEFEAAQELVKRITALEAEIEGKEQEREREAERLQKALGEVWRDVLAFAVEERRREIEARLGERREQELAGFEAEGIRRSLADGRCSQCGQEVVGPARERLQERLSEVEERVGDAREDQGLGTAALALGAISPVGRLEECLDLDLRIGRLNYELVAKRQELEDVRARSGDVAEDEVGVAMSKRDRALQRIGAIEDRISQAKERVDRLATDVSAIHEEIARASRSDEVATLRKRRDLAANVRSIFDKAKDELRDQLRVNVERDASEIFSALTTTPEYQGLRINANYGLETLGPDGEPVPARSAGQEQIVAFALIGALSRNATREAPVIMDTPLARLDTGHRARVLSYLRSMADQVILLVHSAEVSERDIPAFREAVTREFELHPEALFRTEIRERTLA